MNDHLSEEQLAAYIDGTIDRKTRSAVERHLSHCGPCLDDLVDLWEIMRERAPVPDVLLKNALIRFPAGKEEEKQLRFPLANRWALRAAAFFAVALLLGYFLIVERPSVIPLRRATEISDRETVKTDIPLPAPTDKKEVLKSPPAPAKIERKSATGKIEPPAEQAKATAPLLEKDALQVSREEESKKKEALPVSQQVRLEAQKGQPSKGPAPQTRFRAQQDQAVGTASQVQEVLPPPVAIDGDVAIGDLQNKEILSGFLHFPEPLTARISIDPQGKVSEVTIETRVAPEQKAPLRELIGKMLFSPSDKKLRRARLTSGLEPRPK
jgi:hypothetical protein